MRQSQKETEDLAKQTNDAARVTPAVENSGSASVTDEAQKQANAN
jgi:hypothetical protein